MIKDSELSYAELEEMAKSHVCSCGGGLSVAYGGKFGYLGYILRCDRNVEHDSGDFIRPYTPTMANTPGIPGWKLSNRRKSEMVTQLGPERANKLIKYQGTAMLSKEEAREILVTLWPKAPAVEITKAMLICWQYHLNPLMKHVYILGPYKDKKTGEEKWATALGIKANRTLVARKRQYSYVDNTPRKMTDDEQKQIFGVIDQEKFWAITKLKSLEGMEAQGYGFWPRSDYVYGTDKGNSVANMAFIRSERAALDRLSPDQAPPDVEVVDERYTEESLPLKVSVVEPAEKPTSPLEKGSQTASASVGVASGTLGPDKASIETSTVIITPMPKFANWGEFGQYLWDNYKVSATNFLKTTGKKAWTDFKDFEEAWTAFEKMWTAKQEPK